MRKIGDFSMNATARLFLNPHQQEDRSADFLSQKREGAKIANSLTSRLCVRLLFQTFCTRGFLQKPD